MFLRSTECENSLGAFFFVRRVCITALQLTVFPILEGIKKHQGCGYAPSGHIIIIIIICFENTRRCMWEYTMEMNLKEIGRENMD
jgi:hypothetical protein